MTIDVDDIATDVDLDDELGGQTSSGYTLRPRSWADCRPARQFALDQSIKLLGRAHPAIVESDITDVTVLKDAVLWGAAARLYFLAVTSGSGSELFYTLKRDYEKKFGDEIRRLGDAINAACTRTPDPQRRGRRSIALGRR